jgi:hypothetical protein
VNLPELTGKAKYFQRPIVNKYREGKVKSKPYVYKESMWLFITTTACLLKNEPASLCVPRTAKGDDPGAIGKPSVNSAN